VAYAGAAAAAAGASASSQAEAFTYGFLVVEPSEFLKLLGKSKEQVVVVVRRRVGILNRREEFVYIAKYGDFTVLTRSPEPLPLPPGTEVIEARELVLPHAVLTAL